MNKEKNFEYEIEPACVVGTLQKEKLEVENAVSRLIALKEDTANELADELHAISIGLKRKKTYGKKLIRKLEDTLEPILDKTRLSTINTIKYIVIGLAPTPIKAWSSVISGAAAAGFLNLQASYNNFLYSAYAGLSTALVSYITQSIPLTQKDRDNLRQKVADFHYSNLKE